MTRPCFITWCWNQPTAPDRNLLILKHDAVLATYRESPGAILAGVAPVALSEIALVLNGFVAPSCCLVLPRLVAFVDKWWTVRKPAIYLAVSRFSIGLSVVPPEYHQNKQWPRFY